MIVLILVFQLCSGTPLSGLCPNNTNAQARPAEDAILKQRDTHLILSEKRFVSAGRKYLSQVTPYGLSVYLLTETTDQLLRRFEPSYDFTTGEDDLSVPSFVNGHKFVAWRWCEHHFCPIQSGAVIYDPAKNRLFRLEYEEESGLSMSKDLANPENHEIRNWLIRWWSQWPGRAIITADTKIAYKDFPK